MIAFFGVLGGPSVGIAAAEVEFPTRFFPAVETRFGNELHPFVEGHTTELPTDQTDLVVAAFTRSVNGFPLCINGLCESHE